MNYLNSLKFLLHFQVLLAQYMSGSRNNTMVASTKHNSKPATSRSSTTSELFSPERYAFWNYLPTLSYTSVAYNMLIVVAILLVLTIVYKHVAKPSWIPSSQQLSEKFRLYMAGSMVGDFTRWIFNDPIWTRSRQDVVIVPNKDEKSRRLSLDMSSSSSTSLSPSVLPTHNASPRSYKKTSNSRLTSHRRPSSRQKTQSQNTSHIEQSSTITEQDEAKSSVTIHVGDTLNSRVDPSPVDNCQESKGEIDKIDNNQKLGDFIHENINSWTESQQTPTPISNRCDKNRGLNSDLTFLESTNSGSSKLQKKNSLKGHQKQSARNKEQTVGLTTQESDGEIDSIISDDHSDSLIQQSDVSVPTIQKNMHDSTQEETFVKTGHKRRRRRTKGSRNNQQKTQQNQQTQNSDQRSSKQEQPGSSQKQDISLQSSSNVPKSRHVSEKINSRSYHFLHGTLHGQNTHSQQHQSNEISKSRQSVEKSKADILERNPQQHIESQSSRSDQTVYFNKRTSQIYHSANLDDTAIPAKATLLESNRKTAVFPRTDNIHWKPNVITAPSQASNFNSNISNVPISRFATYADVIAPHKSAIIATLPRSNTSGLSNGNNITTPVPVASMNNATNHQWYSPFGSGLSIQLTPPASPQNIHRQLPSTSSSVQSQDRNRNVIAPPPSLSASNNVSSFSSSPSSSLSMFTSSSFPSLSNSLSNQDQSKVIASPANSSFRESLFGRKYPVQDQEKGELSDEDDDSKSRNKIMEASELTNQRTQNDGALLVREGKCGEGTKKENVNWRREQESQQQFSLFDKRLSFMYP
ncbi:hypothetical protein RirG_126240 [Rhizophagus irregularis DAOM 197198w]|uniref:Uncharacterized protein n=3 Tax=Rhizophagus irregularis TaxID=588596 RepID=A0A015J9H6_RHIIW|nr:hypothetical protein RirG_126240 [Rhizophagus irregularis DAOM 197198w]EXX66189.1 hypothetical protein RirG_126240 [Rhizophagus irregularis DAOM 197198w]